MKPPKDPTQPPEQANPVDPKKFPLHAQTGAKAGRDDLRAAEHVVSAPRQTQRRGKHSK